MTDAHNNELVKQYIDTEINDSILDLTVQEIIYLYSVVLTRLKESNEEDEKIKKDRDLVFKAIIIKIMRSGTLYIAYHVVTGYPYIDVRGNSWIFSEKSFAEEAQKHYALSGIPLDIKKLNGNDIVRELYELQRLGIEKLIVDNGQFSTVVYRSDLLREEELPEKPEHQTPQLLYSILTMKELAYASNGKNPNIPQLEKEVFNLIFSSKFLVPVKIDRHLKDGESVSVNDTTSMEIAVFNNSKTGESLVPVFSDWTEFIKTYSKDEWNAVVMSYEMLKDASSSCNGFVINPSSGAGFLVTEDSLNKIQK